VVALFALCAFCLAVASTIPVPLPLNAQQGTQYLGVVYHCSIVVIPALAFAIATSDGPPWLRVGVIAAALFASGYAAIMLLSKAGLVPYIIFLVYVCRERVLKWRALALAFLATPLLTAIYDLRDSTPAADASLFDRALVLIFRVPLISENAHIVHWLSQHQPLWSLDVWSIPWQITEEVFGYDPASIGIAPSYAGVFNALFGAFGFFGAMAMIPLIAHTVGRFSRPTLVDRVLYYLWALEFVHFLIDGSMTFYTATTHGAMFWGLVGVSTARILVRHLRMKTPRAAHPGHTYRIGVRQA
jgi:hypothetical protein